MFDKFNISLKSRKIIIQCMFFFFLAGIIIGAFVAKNKIKEQEKTCHIQQECSCSNYLEDSDPSLQ